jgi:hypothetical protein
MNIPGFSEEALTEVSTMLEFAQSPCSAGRKPRQPRGPKGPGNPQGGSSKEVSGLRMLG